MQSFYSVPSGETLTNSRQYLLNNDFTVMSQNSGTSFPTSNMQVGMPCHRTDLNSVWVLKDMTPTWVKVFDLTKTYVSQEYVDNGLAGKIDKTSANRPGVTKLYRSDGDSNFSVQTSWDGTYWWLKGYAGDSYHGGCAVAYATLAGTAIANGGTSTYTNYVNNDAYSMRFHWSGQGAQPSWLWGSNDGQNIYVYNPSNFSVSYAASAGNADTLDGHHWSEVSSISGNAYYAGSTQGNRTLISAIIANIAQASGTNSFSVDTYDYTSGSGNIAVAKFSTTTGIPAGTYNLQNIIQQLVYKSHSHSTTLSYSDCNCNCVCDCNCSTDS